MYNGSLLPQQLIVGHRITDSSGNRPLAATDRARRDFKPIGKLGELTIKAYNAVEKSL